MIKKIFLTIASNLRKLILVSIFFVVSCQQIPQKDPFILSEIPQIQAYEKQDHAFCAEIKTDFDRGDLMTSKYYWRCRLSLAKYRIQNGSDPFMQKSNLEISDLVTKISLKLSQSSDYILAHENAKMDSRHHKQCQEMGYEINTTNQTKIDDYFACRIALIYQYQDEPPFGNSQYQKFPNHSYNFSYVISRKIDRDIEEYKKQKQNYPNCVKFNLFSADFKNCTKAYDANKMCLAEVPKQKFLKDLEEKISCQKRSYQAFPDSMLKDQDDELSKERQRSSRSSDYYNNNSFAAIGVDVNSFAAVKEKSETEVSKNKEKDNLNFEEKVSKQVNLVGDGIKDAAKKLDQRLNDKVGENTVQKPEEKKTETKPEKKNEENLEQKSSEKKNENSKEISAKKQDPNFNTNKEIYSKAELTKLRQRYIFSCQKEAEKRTEIFVQGLNSKCEEKKKFQLVDEE